MKRIEPESKTQERLENLSFMKEQLERLVAVYEQRIEEIKKQVFDLEHYDEVENLFYSFPEWDDGRIVLMPRRDSL